MPSFTRPLSVAEASEQSGEPRRTIRYAITAGHLKAEKLPGLTGAWLIKPNDLQRWIASQSFTACTATRCVAIEVHGGSCRVRGTAGQP